MNTPHTESPLLVPHPPAGEEQRVAAILGAVEQHLGFVPDGLRLYSISPPLLEAFVANISYFRGGSPLSPVLTTMIRYLVSAQAGCQFCIDLNEGFLNHLGIPLEEACRARENPEWGPIEARERPLLNLALQAVNDPDAVHAATLQAARDQGWHDRDMFDAVVQAANNRAFNHVPRTFKLERQGSFA